MVALRRWVGIMVILGVLLTFHTSPVMAQKPAPDLENDMQVFEEAGVVTFNQGNGHGYGYGHGDVPPDVRRAIERAFEELQPILGDECGPCPDCCANRIAYRTLRTRQGQMVAFFYQIVYHCWDNGVLTAAEVVAVNGWTYDPHWQYLGIHAQGHLGGVGGTSYTSGIMGKFGHLDGTPLPQYVYPQSFITITGDGGNWANYGDDWVN